MASARVLSSLLLLCCTLGASADKPPEQPLECVTLMRMACPAEKFASHEFSYHECMACSHGFHACHAHAPKVSDYCHEIMGTERMGNGHLGVTHELPQVSNPGQVAAEKASKALAQGDGQAALAAFKAAFAGGSANGGMIKALDTAVRDQHTKNAAHSPLKALAAQTGGTAEATAAAAASKKAPHPWYEGPLVIPLCAALSLVLGLIVGQMGHGSGGHGKHKKHKYSSVSQRRSRI
jgi:hypothetical protein